MTQQQLSWPIARIGILLVALLVVITSFFWDQETATARNEVTSSYRSEDEQRTIDIYSQTSGAVVFISTITLTVDPFDIVGGYQQREGSGSGIIVDREKGIIITNLHVIQDAHKIEIILSDGQSYRARLLGHDEEYDLAVLQLAKPPKNLVSIEMGDSNRLEVGQHVLAIGNPHGLNRTLTEGIISSLDRTVRNPNRFLMKGLIQTDAAINPGNSGGPLLDMDGRLIGMNMAILSKSGDSAGIGFAVPINTIQHVLPELVATGRVLRPRIGWILVDTDQGPMVRRVIPESPAQKAGVQAIERPVESVFMRGYVRDFERADLIYRVNGKRVMQRTQVDEIISQSRRREPLKFTLRRGGAHGEERVVSIIPNLQ